MVRKYGSPLQVGKKRLVLIEKERFRKREIQAMRGEVENRKAWFRNLEAH